ncbi:hypothetical protein [Burkholderia plantarii]|uniref:hypothetical protein n=1 Tax=Burkholderia plantarii TaxID=41899 RepID=UPI0018DBED9D|nr:hypothetical protein [Burkholderia plantarii]
MKTTSRFICRGSLMAGLAALSLVTAAAGAAQSLTCPGRTPIGGLPGAQFEDGSFGVTGPLNVNPDGAKASYTQDDRGFTYIANGMNRLNPAVDCRHHLTDCAKAFRTAEQGHFGPGTPEFCVYAIEVDPIPPATKTLICRSDGAKTIGNGKGVPRLGPDQLDRIEGGQIGYYVSMTRLNQLVDGKPQAIDSLAVPGIVVPKTRADLVGHVVYAAYQGRSTLAVVNDTGPAFGEGSIALHEMLRYGALQTPPKIGPISVANRCKDAELAIKPPYTSRPDVDNDHCDDPGKRRSAADVRAYTGIRSGVTMIVLGKASLPMKNSVATAPVTLDALKHAASEAGYTDAKLADMAHCL